MYQVTKFYQHNLESDMHRSLDLNIILGVNLVFTTTCAVDLPSQSEHVHVPCTLDL